MKRLQWQHFQALFILIKIIVEWILLKRKIFQYSSKKGYGMDLLSNELNC